MYDPCTYRPITNRQLSRRYPEPYYSYGNGAAMRVSPCAIYAEDLQEALRLAEISAAVTHNHPEGIKGTRAVAAAAFLAKRKTPKEKIRAFVEENFYPLTETIHALHKVYRYSESCQDTVPRAFVAFFESFSFEDAIRNAVYIGGDSDTIAAITGSIAWPYYMDSTDDGHDSYMKEAISYLPPSFVRFINIFPEKP